MITDGVRPRQPPKPVHTEGLIDARPSSTAQRVAIRRAAHQILDRPLVFEDPLAVAIAGTQTAENQETSFGRSMRAFLVARSRFAEDRLRQSLNLGTQQYVILGAGLDTFAYRNPFERSGLRVFEVDHPATQAWKHLRLAEAAIPVPSSLTYVPVDFENQTLADGLQQAGFDSRKISFFSWLGVVPYLTREAVISSLKFIASQPAASAVAFDYGVPRSALTWKQRFVFDALAERVAAAGEPFQTFFEPDELAGELRRLGFSQLEDWSATEIHENYFAGREDGLGMSGGMAHFICARI